MSEIENTIKLFKMRFLTEEILNDMGVVRTQKITDDFGEWLAEQLFNGKRAEKVNQQGWDIVTSEGYYQVKTHRKAESTPAKWSKIKTLDYSVKIFQLNPNYTIKNIYSISNEKLLNNYHNGKLKKKGNEYTLYWNTCDIITEQFRSKYPMLFK